MIASGPCHLCGRVPAAGFAQIGDAWYCHGGETVEETLRLMRQEGGLREPTCYEKAVRAGVHQHLIGDDVLASYQRVVRRLTDRWTFVGPEYLESDSTLRPGRWYRFIGEERGNEPMTPIEQGLIYGRVVADYDGAG